MLYTWDNGPKDCFDLWKLTFDIRCASESTKLFERLCFTCLSIGCRTSPIDWFYFPLCLIRKLFLTVFGTISDFFFSSNWSNRSIFEMNSVSFSKFGPNTYFGSPKIFTVCLLTFCLLKFHLYAGYIWLFLLRRSLNSNETFLSSSYLSIREYTLFSTFSAKIYFPKINNSAENLRQKNYFPKKKDEQSFQN